MPSYRAPDGTELAFHLKGEGRPLICLPGGPCRIPITWATSAACPPAGS
jgi:hypothetical protein